MRTSILNRRPHNRKKVTTTSIKSLLFAIIASGAVSVVPACVDGLPDDHHGDSLANDDGNSPDDTTRTESETTDSPSAAPRAASSSSIANTDGTRAAEAFFNRSGGDAACDGPCIALFDAKCDSHSVYVEYQINNGSTTRRTNGGGCNTTLRIPLSGNFNISYKACVDIQLGSDACGPTRFDHNP